MLLAAALLSAVLLLPSLAAYSGEAAPPRRILHLDLHSLGAVNLEVPNRAVNPWVPSPLHSGQVISRIYPESVSFVGPSVLAISFPIFNSRAVVSSRGDPQGGSRLLQTAVVDLSTGRARAETSWPSAETGDLVLALDADRFLVRSGDKLLVVSREWKEERTLELKKPAPGEHAVRLLLSPTLQTLFLIVQTGPHQESVEVLASETLTRLHAFTVESVGLDAASDSYFAYLLPGEKGYAMFVLPLKALGKGNLPSLQPVYFTQQDGCNRPYFVADDRLILTGFCDSLALIGANGGVRARRAFGRTRFLAPPIRSSRDQRRFAFSVADGPAFPNTEGMSDPLCVYDTDRLATVSEVELNPRSQEQVPVLDYALSADGSLLAVLYGYDLSVYQLPPSASTSSPAAVTQVTGAVPATVSAGSSAQPAAPATTIGAGGGQSSELPIGTAAHGPAIEVTANLLDLHHDAIQAWVQISNRGTTDLALTPENATLDILNPGRKTLAALKPDRLAFDIKRVGQVDADYERKARCDFRNPYADCGPAYAAAERIRQDAEATAADVKASALRVQTLKAGEQVQGAIFFTYQKKRGESVLRLPIGDQVFEFRFPPKAK